VTLPDEILEDAVDAAGEPEDTTPAEVDAQRQRVREHISADDEDRWQYESGRNYAHVQLGLLNAELDAICNEPGGSVRTYRADTQGVPLGFTVSTDDDQSIGTLVHLDPEQAERLAADLLQHAHTVRQEVAEAEEAGGRDA
jgi:hypothetical protein